ncbi:MAG TPA: hypothetical protein VG734_19440 [Lacunisphaera sp.]|nr:hypothetical protein [Lacunisphaera sp.]
MDATRTTSPCRLLAAFLAQKARLLAALRDEGGLFELRFLSRLVKREQDAVVIAAASATTINTSVSTLRQDFLAALADDHTPGEIDPQEAATLQRALALLSTRTTRHANQLERLT